MGKFYTGESTFSFSWEQVAQAFWCRYPNPYSNHVLTEDVIWREVRDNKLYSKRLLTKTNPLPSWGQRFINSRAVCIVEESIVDPVQKTIVTYTRNIGYNKVMNVEEKCIYRCIDGIHQSTALERQAWVSSHIFGFARAIQAFGIERFRKNSTKAHKGFQHVLEAMFKVERQIEPQNIIPLLDKSRLKETAKKATELAKSKATPLVAAAAACAQNNQ